VDSPRDRYISVPGRKPALEALENDAIEVAKVLISRSAKGEGIGEIIGAAERRKVIVERTSEHHVTAVAGSSRHHQGVVADVVAPRMRSLTAFLETRRKGRDYNTAVFVLDRVHNPANVGMILRSAVAADIDGVVLPSVGTASIGPVTIKSSAGVAFKAPILRSETTADALLELQNERFEIIGLDAGGEHLFAADLPQRIAFVLGNESEGISDEAIAALDRVVSLPLANGVESLNVAATASILAYELVRRSS
jgi:23S rRNA (guanosine2251-2'-O)-methyltransferase